MCLFFLLGVSGVRHFSGVRWKKPKWCTGRGFTGVGGWFGSSQRAGAGTGALCRCFLLSGALSLSLLIFLSVFLPVFYVSFQFPSPTSLCSSLTHADYPVTPQAFMTLEHDLPIYLCDMITYILVSLTYAHTCVCVCVCDLVNISEYEMRKAKLDINEQNV